MTVLRTAAATVRYWMDRVCAHVLDALDTKPATFGPTVRSLDYLNNFEKTRATYIRELDAFYYGTSDDDRAVIEAMERQFTKDWS